ncbi:SDR family NAD(P)-dependent oxidoreductase [Nakamurella antarctica]|uniref:SDR family NAD(P)-dependent oxidoreductase n=1 Tax=Nakamurella antarctica TaxID=1902245 RepID=A0A3G8ZR38_9ACTN|nr:oxidoreductase [Nakamurella antarctica]AZI57024.1 SDR family NAD(P)-dependent oxidoreductase [Nakamurella antarctica]
MHSIPSQAGKRALITGANTGLGYQSALALAGAGAEVVIAVRDTAKGDKAARAIIAAHPRASVEVAKLDLADLASVRDFAAGFSGSIDILMANAGLMLVPTRTLTVDGFEMQMGVNHLGHYALIGHLLPNLRKAPAARVVSLSSMAHLQAGRLDRRLGVEGPYTPMGQYGQSKLANAMFAIEFDRRLRAAGESTIALAAHPGWSATDLFGRKYTDKPNAWVFFSRKMTAVLGSSPAKGAQSQIAAATAPGAEGGSYLGPKYTIRGAPGVAQFSKFALDADDGAWLWEESARLTDTDFGL